MNLKIFFSTLLLLLASSPAFAQDVPAQQTAVDPKKLAAIHELLELTGASNLSKQVLLNITEALKQSRPEVDPHTWDRLAEKMDTKELEELIIGVYDRHFTTDDLRATIAFYKSPSGQRILKELPAVMSESMALGQNWGREKAAELNRELQDEQSAAQKHGE